jgi:ABC-type phosphate transport system substrate-binding protein
MRIIIRVSLLFGIVLANTAAFAADFVVIVNSGNTVASLSTRDVASLFLKKKTQWDGGARVVPVVLPDAAAATAAFDRQVLNRTAAALRAYWQQEIFSGRSVPPAEKASDEDVVAFVQKTPGAIGYISATTAHTGVKVLTVSE